MADFTQKNRPIGVSTDLGDDKLLLEQFTMSEALSRPFHMSMTMLAQPDYTLPFDKLLGQNASVRLDIPNSQTPRYFHGVVFRISEGMQVHSPDTGKTFIRYWAELVPAFSKLTRSVNSRIFQHLSVPDILAKVLTGVTFSKDNIKGTYDPRDYCVQWQETDFQFASRLMEEEGIFYYFKHAQDSHTMVLSDQTTGFDDLPGGASVVFNEFKGLRDKGLHEDRVMRWKKSQELRSGKWRSWDYTFEMPDKNLEATGEILESVSVGTVTHKMKVGGNDSWEIYDYPGGYADHYDGIDKGGAQASDLSKIETDNKRVVGIRMQQEAVPGLAIDGESNVRSFLPGYKITLSDHFNANGDYAITAVEHIASIEGTYSTNQNVHLKYHNRFRCIPAALPYRPAQTAPKPRIYGTQTAVVVGNDATTEIATDKYGRVKVQFPWDRDGKKTLDSSCWVRVAQIWAGKRWGGFFLPRVKDEVIVAFEEGDPDRPIIVGCVYNDAQLPPYDLPDNKTRSTIKTRSSEKGTTDTWNEIRFEDKKDSEEIFIHAEKDYNREVENNDTLKVGFDKKNKGDQTISIYNNRTVSLDQGNESFTVKKGTRTVTVKSDDTHEVQEGNLSVTVDKGNASYTISKGKCTVTAQQSIELTVGQSSIKITPSQITIQAQMVTITANATLQLQGKMSKLNGSATVQLQGGMVKIN